MQQKCRETPGRHFGGKWPVFVYYIVNSHPTHHTTPHCSHFMAYRAHVVPLSKVKVLERKVEPAAEHPGGSNVAAAGSSSHPGKNLEFEPAWEGGPLRKTGTGNGSASVYVCGRCLKAVQGVYFHEGLKSAGIAVNDWVGGECRP